MHWLGNSQGISTHCLWSLSRLGFGRFSIHAFLEFQTYLARNWVIWCHLSNSFSYNMCFAIVISLYLTCVFVFYAGVLVILIFGPLQHVGSHLMSPKISHLIWLQAFWQVTIHQYHFVWLTLGGALHFFVFLSTDVLFWCSFFNVHFLKRKGLSENFFHTMGKSLPFLILGNQTMLKSPPKHQGTSHFKLTPERLTCL